jgi:hypothetical protein
MIEAYDMALHFPSHNICRFDTAGERRLAERLKKTVGRLAVLVKCTCGPKRLAAGLCTDASATRYSGTGGQKTEG